jgi:hypothetical protein
VRDVLSEREVEVPLSSPILGEPGHPRLGRTPSLEVGDSLRRTPERIERVLQSTFWIVGRFD